MSRSERASPRTSLSATPLCPADAADARPMPGGPARRLDLLAGAGGPARRSPPRRRRTRSETREQPADRDGAVVAVYPSTESAPITAYLKCRGLGRAAGGGGDSRSRPASLPAAVREAAGGVR